MTPICVLDADSSKTTCDFVIELPSQPQHDKKKKINLDELCYRD